MNLISIIFITNTITKLSHARSNHGKWYPPPPSRERAAEQMETVCVKRRRRHAALFLENRRRGGGGFENWRSKEGKEGRKSARLESIFRVCLDWGEHGGINDLMGHHHERRAESRDVMATDMAALSLFNRGREGCCNGYPSCKGRCWDQAGCHLARKRLARSSTEGRKEATSTRLRFGLGLLLAPRLQV